MPKRLPGPKLYVYFAIIGIPLAIVLAVRLAINLVLRRLKMASSVAEIYNRMCQLAALSKIGPLAEETPLEYCTRLAQVVPSQARAIENITQAYVETRFSPRKEPGRLQYGRVQKSWVELCPKLMKRMLPFKRSSG
jgi:hypothetical protein